MAEPTFETILPLDAETRAAGDEGLARDLSELARKSWRGFIPPPRSRLIPDAECSHVILKVTGLVE